MSQSFCTQCGAKLPEAGNFCPQCGAPVEGVSASAAAPPPPGPSPLPPPVAQPTVPTTTTAKTTGGSRPLLYGVGALAVIAALLAVVYFGFLRPDDANETSAGIQSLPASPSVAPDIPFPDVARVPVDEAYARFEEGSALFVDVRDRDSYTTMHIPGAVWIPLDEVYARHAELPADALIFTYCT